jgi:hypothetical protein
LWEAGAFLALPWAKKVGLGMRVVRLEQRSAGDIGADDTRLASPRGGD